ncbi:hypothetical protein DPEC_G00062010 [Dallia pectoralis]|uniref:Uncharacterized protein n=1 Tax=Dallia pectoralis TaxID=75939 RepID=A0ACC2H7Y8_DALPE|nr:hypothetical protein DPEC_G00062010 [Dallia pectoralis]
MEKFESRVFAEMCQRLGVEKMRTTPPHPQSDGLVERFHRTLGQQLAIVTEKHQKDWDTHLPLVLMACRSAVQDSTACSPALLMLGRELRTPAEMVFGRPPEEAPLPAGLDYARRLQDRLSRPIHLPGSRWNVQACGRKDTMTRERRGVTSWRGS